MTTLLNGAQSPLSFSPSQRVRITNLQTPHDDLSTRHVAAQVVLIWPYSSSTRRFSLLLSETDARPFKGRKQLKVTFLNGAARAAQDTHVGIGDEIRLQLEGCQWAETSDAIATPGKRVDGDIQFRKYLAFEILRDTGPSRQVCYEATGTPSPVTSPVVNGSLAELGALQDVQITTKRFSVPYSSPAVRKENRKSSGSYLDSPLDPFAEDKDYVYGRSRKRTKFARPSGDWRLIDDDDEVELGTEVTELATPSKAPDPEMTREVDAADEVSGVVETQDAPEMVDLTSPIQETFASAPVIIDTATSQPMRVAEDSGNDFVDESATLMKPPETPARSSKRQKPSYIDLEDHAEDSDATSTPRLMPMPSPGLPLVSPLIRNSGVDVGYFPSASELDANGQPEQEIADVRRPSTSSASEPSSDGSLVIVDARSTPAPEPIPSRAIKADVVEDEDMYGASQPPHPPHPPQPVAELEIETPQRSRDALDVLEEFLQISPTLPDEPLGLEVDGNAADGDIDEAEPEASSQSDAESSDEESSQIPVERLTSPPQPQLAEVEHEEQERSAPSRSLSLDGAVDDDDRRPSPPASPDISFQIRQATPDTLPAASQQIQVEVKTVVDEAARSLRSHRNQLPPTPSNTQDAQPARDLVETETIEVSLLPTPDNTQDREQLPSSHLVPSQDEIAVEETDTSMKAPKEAEGIRATRRTSQLPSRQQIMANDISSPYFTPRRPQKPPQPPPNRDKTPVPSSPPVEASISPTRPVTRSQRLTSKAPSLPPVADSHAEEVETSPSVQTELTQDLISKTGITTSISYYAPLASIDQHRDQFIDIIAVAVDESTKPLRAKSGPKDHYNMLRLVDPSLDSKTRVTIQIFRHAREALPSTRRGDVVLLRSFKPQSVKHKFLLNSGSESAWAVFNANPNSRTMYDDVAISGPPVEYSRGETAQVKKLVQWWQTQGAESFPVFGKKSTTETLTQTEQPLPEQSPSKDQEDILESVEPPPLSPRRTRRRNNRTDNINNEDDALSPDIEQRDITPTSTRHQPPRKAKSKTPAPAPATNGTRASTPSHSQTTPVTKRNGSATPQAQKRHASATPGRSGTPTTAQKRTSTPTGAKSRRSPTVVHELRDGTKYVDDGREKNGGVVHELRDGRNYVDE